MRVVIIIALLTSIVSSAAYAFTSNFTKDFRADSTWFGGSSSVEDNSPERYARVSTHQNYLMDEIRLSKTVSDVNRASSRVSGNFDVSFDFVVKNIGGSTLTDLELIDDFFTQIGGAYVRIASPPIVTRGPVVLRANPSYFGRSSSNMFLPGGSLGPDEEVAITLIVELKGSLLAATSSNSATINARVTGSTLLVSDISDSGIDPESTNPGAPGDTGGSNDPTPISDCSRAFGSLTCQSFQVSVDQNCGTTFALKDFVTTRLEDCFGNMVPVEDLFTLTVFSPQGAILPDLDPSTPDILELDLSSYIGSILTYELRSNTTSVKCSNFFNVEDRLGPQIVCPTEDIQITCLEDLSCVPLPTAVENCGGTVTLTEIGSQIISNDLCVGQEILKTYRAFDSNGNASASCSITIKITQAEVVFPEDVLWTCEQYEAYNTITDPRELLSCIPDADLGTSAIEVDLIPGADDTACPGGENDVQIAQGCSATTLCNLSNGLGIDCASPNIAGLEDDDILELTGSGVPNVYKLSDPSLCKFIVSFTDETLPVCGLNTNTFKIIRRWRVLNECTNETLEDFQVIEVGDRINPVVSVPARIDLTANSSSAQGICGSSGLLPVPTISDNCSGVDLSSVVVNTTAGQATPLVISGQTEGYQIPAPFLAVGGPYTVSYIVTDNCGNITTVTTQVFVEDIFPPVAICDEMTNLSLTGAATTALLAGQLDDGSTDNCNNVWFKVLRMDEMDAVSVSTNGVGNTSAICGQANSDDQIEPANSSYFDDEAFFCCDDITANNKTVVVRVFDVDPGNGAVNPDRFQPTGDLFNRFNDCVVEVEVEDRLGPIKILDAPDRTINCTNVVSRQQYLDDQNLTFDAPVFQDNCTFEVTLQVIDNTTACGDGTIIRRFEATDINGNVSALCEQRITSALEHNYTISWPQDEELNMCAADGTIDSLSSLNGLTENACDQLSVSFVDTRISLNNNACFQIFRTYEVINLCEWDGVSAAIRIDNPTTSTVGPRLDVVLQPDGTEAVNINSNPTTITSVGRWTYTQLIQSQDDEDPVLGTITQAACEAIDGVDDVLGAGCGQSISVDFELTDNCGGLLTPTYRLATFVEDADDDGQISAVELAAGTLHPNDPFAGTLSAPTGSTAAIAQSGTFTISGAYPLGNHVFIVTVTDLCGNAVELLVPFTAEDCKPPTPVAIAFSTIDLTSTGVIELSPSDIDNGSFDECGPIVLSFSSDTTNTSMTFTCTEIGANAIDLWVTDMAGNQSSVSSVVTIEDTGGHCTAGLTRTIAGNVQTMIGQTVEFVNVSVKGGYIASSMTNVDGGFEFSEVTNCVKAEIVPERGGIAYTGITTNDMFYIGQHVLGIELIATPEQLIAADVTNDHVISAFDITACRRIILGLDKEFQRNTSWRFVSADYSFPDPSNPWEETFPESLVYDPINKDMMSSDFTAIKIGDVNNSVVANSGQALAPRTITGEFALVAENAFLAAGEKRNIAFTANNLNAQGYQFTLEWNPDDIEVLGLEGGVHPTSGFGMHLLHEGKLTMSHDGEMEGELFNLEIQALRDGVELRETFSVGSSVTVAEAFAKTGELSIALQFSGSTKRVTNKLEQNQPNPFRGLTQIGFTLDEAGPASLMVTDLTGRVVWRTDGYFNAGRSQIEISAEDLNATGLLNYTLIAGEFTATRRMIVLK